MSQEHEVEVLVLRGAEGETYAIPLELLEACRVPEEDLGSLGDDDEVSGFARPSFILGPVKPWNPPVNTAPQVIGGFRPPGGHIWAR